MSSEQTQAEMKAQTDAAFCACNMTDGFRVPEGMRLLFRGESGQWIPSAMPPTGVWPVDNPHRLVPIVVAPEPAPLGPEDVPPGSEFSRGSSRGGYDWLDDSGISIAGLGAMTWAELAASPSQINRPRHRDADGHPTLWEPCSKPATPTVVDWPGDGYRLLVEGETIIWGDEALTEDRGVRSVSGAVGMEFSVHHVPIRRRMPPVCPFAPWQVLETITDREDAKWWQRNHGVYFQVLLHPEGRWTHLVDTEHAFSGPPSHYRRSP